MTVTVAGKRRIVERKFWPTPSGARPLRPNNADVMRSSQILRSYLFAFATFVNANVFRHLLSERGPRIPRLVGRSY
ncbi:hypothetical protein AGR4B_Cc30019 [Agrobacterium tumefaciens str. CFBP 5621]|nr:hypothetical protein AGR4B_Cc30019 [Agrobacterium tumefaciens str. CFBP 5621]